MNFCYQNKVGSVLEEAYCSRIQMFTLDKIRQRSQNCRAKNNILKLAGAFVIQQKYNPSASNYNLCVFT